MSDTVIAYRSIGDLYQNLVWVQMWKIQNLKFEQFYSCLNFDLVSH